MNKVLITKKEFDALECVNNVPKVVWCFWANGEMAPNRKKSFMLLKKNIGVSVCMISLANVKEFERADNPLHPSFQYLSAVHQSDYLRAYLLHFYGGAWHDIKATQVNISDAWQEFLDPNVYFVGKPEVLEGPAKIADKQGRWMPKYWSELVSVICWVGRQNTTLSKELLENFNNYLDSHFEDLKKFPAVHPRERKIEAKNFIVRIWTMLKNKIFGRKNNYPLPWTVFGNIFHPLNYKYRIHVKRNLPKDKVKNAGVYHL